MNLKMFCLSVITLFSINLLASDTQLDCLILNGRYEEREVVSGHRANASRIIESGCNFIKYRLDNLDLYLIPGETQRVEAGPNAYAEFTMINHYFDGLIIRETFFSKESRLSNNYIKKFLFEMKFVKDPNNKIYIIRTRLDFPDRISSAITELYKI